MAGRHHAFGTAFKRCQSAIAGTLAEIGAGVKQIADLGLQVYEYIGEIASYSSATKS
jgi:hypothetical protein